MPDKTIAAVEKAVKDLTRPTKRLIGLLVAVVIALVAVAVVLGINVNNNANLANRLQQGAQVSCEAGNVYRAEQTQIWDSFIDLLLTPNSDKAAQVREFKAFVATLPPDQQATWTKFLGVFESTQPSARAEQEGKQFKAYVAQIDSARNCSKLYGAGG